MKNIKQEIEEKKDFDMEEKVKEELNYSEEIEEKCKCNEGLSNGLKFDCACKIHQKEENEN
jgi:hypothetical protein